MKYQPLLALVVAVAGVVGCREIPAQPLPSPSPGIYTKAPDATPELTPLPEGETLLATVEVNGETFALRLFDTAPARALLEHMPFSLEMDDYARQEKVAYLAWELPAAATETPATIHAGDLYLWSGNNLVLFYTTFSNTYGGYVPLGRIENADALARALGGGSVEISFHAAQ